MVLREEGGILWKSEARWFHASIHHNHTGGSLARSHRVSHFGIGWSKAMISAPVRCESIICAKECRSVYQLSAIAAGLSLAI